MLAEHTTKMWRTSVASQSASRDPGPTTWRNLQEVVGFGVARAVSFGSAWQSKTEKKGWPKSGRSTLIGTLDAIKVTTHLHGARSPVEQNSGFLGLGVSNIR